MKLIDGGGVRKIEHLDDIRTQRKMASDIGLPEDGQFHLEDIGETIFSLGIVAMKSGLTDAEVFSGMILGISRFANKCELPEVTEWPEILSVAINNPR